MPNVRIKKAPRTGDQEDYSLVYNDVATSEAKPKEGVKNTMTAVPRKEASIEVEGGESVIGDINQDGFLELMSFQGKRHYEGGMPVNIPDGSFIFSDTSKLRITDPELLKYFGMGNNKKGYTPAQISKKYQINEYINTLKNEDADDIAKKTANEMLKNNTKKLAELAIVQESMKGFENGVPDFAASVMAGLQGEQPQMKEGGILPKAQYGLEPYDRNKQRSKNFNDFLNNQILVGADYIMNNLLTAPIKLGGDAVNWFFGEPFDYYYNWGNVDKTNIKSHSNFNYNSGLKTTPVNQYKNDPNTPIKPSIKYPTVYPIEIEGTRINNKEEYDLFLKNKGVNTALNQTTKSSTGTSSNQTYINPNFKREEKIKKYESYYSE